MPKSKRNKVVALNKTKKKGKEWKEGLIELVRNCVEKYPTVYLFRHENMRNEVFKELRDELKDSGRFVLGSNKMLQVALGKTPADELRTNLHLLSNRLRGHVGLFFTALPREQVADQLEAFSHEDFARAGGVALLTYRLQAGPLSGPGGPLPHTMEAQLRKLGMPTKLNKGVVELLADYTVCTEGDTLDPNQAALLRVFGIKMATFKLKLLASWASEGDAFQVLCEEDDGSVEGSLEHGEELEGDEEEEEDNAEFKLPDDAHMMLPS